MLHVLHKTNITRNIRIQWTMCTMVQDYFLPYTQVEDQRFAQIGARILKSGGGSNAFSKRVFVGLMGRGAFLGGCDIALEIALEDSRGGQTGEIRNDV